MITETLCTTGTNYACMYEDTILYPHGRYCCGGKVCAQQACKEKKVVLMVKKAREG